MLKNCEILATCGRCISLVGIKLILDILTLAKLSFVIYVTGVALEFGTRLAETIIKKIYYQKISNKIKKDKEKSFNLLTKELSAQIELDDLNKLRIDLRLNSSFQDVKTTFDKLCIV